MADTRYEHSGASGDALYYTNTGTKGYGAMENQKDNVGEHVALRYSGIKHTTLYTEVEFKQGRNTVNDVYMNSTSSEFLSRLNRTQNASWTAGGRIVPNRFLTFTTQVKAHNNVDNYDNIKDTLSGTTGRILLYNYIRNKGVDETSTLTWKPYRWIQNSFRYQLSNTVYNLYAKVPSSSSLDYNKSKQFMGQYTYEITVQPIDPVILMLSYTHAQSYIRTYLASNPDSANYNDTPYIPPFNSGYNSWFFSSSYSPTDNLTFINTASYTLSSNYNNVTNSIPFGSSFKELNLGFGL
ncbi:MAG: hypothetical protein WCH62_01420, partial [Candidatus Omnitrophota bacterium]